MAARRVFGRVRAEAGSESRPSRVVLELTKAGLSVRRKGCKLATAALLTPQVLAQVAGRKCAPFSWASADGKVWEFQLAEAGLLVRSPGRPWRTVPFRELANIGRAQPELFPELLK